MRKLFYIGFCAILVMGIGCAVTNYELITDNNQVKKPKGKQSAPGYTVQTSGKAHIQESSQIATIWDDGTDELIWFVDQKKNGNRKLFTYNNFSTGDEATFHDDLYCNPDRQGCSIWTSEDPETGDVSIFDGSFNPNCNGARSLTYLISTTRYYGECGKAKLDPMSRLTLASNMQPTANGTFTQTLDAKNFSLVAVSQNDGARSAIRIAGNAGLEFFMNGSKPVGTFLVSNPVNRVTFNQLSRFVSEHGSTFRAEICWNGVCFDSPTMKANEAGRNLASRF